MVRRARANFHIAGKRKQPVYDFALIRVNKALWHKDTSIRHRMSPICLPPKHLWRNRFHRVVVQIAGYGRIEREEEEGR